MAKKTKNIQTLKVLARGELEQRLRESKSELLKLKFEASQGKLKKIHLLKRIKRQIARILTLLNTTHHEQEKQAKK